MPGPYYDPGIGEPSADIYARIAAEIVAELAPPPDPETTEYQDKAADAEFLVLEWLKATKGGTLTAKGGIPSATGSKTFSEMKVVRSIVRGQMGEFYTGGSAASVGYVGAFPR